MTYFMRKDKYYFSRRHGIYKPGIHIYIPSVRTHCGHTVVVYKIFIPVSDIVIVYYPVCVSPSVCGEPASRQKYPIVVFLIERTGKQIHFLPCFLHSLIKRKVVQSVFSGISCSYHSIFACFLPAYPVQDLSCNIFCCFCPVCHLITSKNICCLHLF